MGKHTSGPWKVEYRPKTNEWWIELSPKEGSTTCAIRCAPYDNKQTEANAHLISAAPELLEALKLALPALKIGEYRLRVNDWAEGSPIANDDDYVIAAYKKRLNQMRVAIATMKKAIARAEGKNEN